MNKKLIKLSLFLSLFLVLFSCNNVVKTDQNSDDNINQDDDNKDDDDQKEVENHIDIGKEKLKVENNKLVDNDGNELVIHAMGIGDGPSDNELNFSKYTKTTYQSLKNEGFNTIRCMFSVTCFYDFTYNRVRNENLEILDFMISNAKEVGIYLIIDIHILRPNEFSFYSYDDSYCLIGQNESEESQAKANNYRNIIKTVWKEIVNHTKNNDCILAYSLINEPYGGIKVNDINKQETNEDRQKVINEYKEEIRNDYSQFINELISEIREIDPLTIISFQRLAALCDVSKTLSTNSYKFASFVDYGLWNESERYPLLKEENSSNIMLDLNHIYDNGIYDFTVKEEDSSCYNKEVGVINMDKADGVNVDYNWYNSEYEMDKNYYKSIEVDKVSEENSGKNTIINKNLTVELSAKDNLGKEGDNRASLLGWGAIYAENATNSYINLNSFSIYKEINQEKVKIFYVDKNSSEEKKEVYGFGEEFGLSHNLNEYNNLFGSCIQSLKLGIKENETIYLVFDIDQTFTDYESDNTAFSFQISREIISKNENGEDLISGSKAVEKTFIEAKEIADSYNSPIYFGEFCVRSQYVNEYTNYKAYTKEFARLSELYHASWVWHCLSEQSYIWTNDNGYGAYIGTYGAIEEYKNEKAWEVILVLLEKPSIYLVE